MAQQLRSDIWCAAFVRRQNDLGHFCVVARRGDSQVGQIWIEVDHLDGTASLYVPAPSAGFEEIFPGRIFQRRYTRVDPLTVRERIAREVEFDQDLWVLAVDYRGDDIGVDLVD